MNVCMFSRYPRDYTRPKGGVESVTVILVKTLSRLEGMDVHLITFESDIKEEIIEKIGNATIHRLPCSNWPQIVDILIGPGRRRLLRKITELAPDIVHAHETFGLTLGSIKTPFVFTVHGFDNANIPAEKRKFAKLRSIVWKWVEDFGLARQKSLISISPYVKSMIAPHTTAKIYEIDNPVDDRFFKIRRREEPGRILCVGWINERKNTLGAVKAFAMARKRGAIGKLIIAGEPQQQSYLDKVKFTVESNGISEAVEFLGYIKQDQLIEELSKASVMLLPSLQENAPMAISEAMAAGIPVIASNCCGMPFMVEDGKSGFLIDPYNTSQIADSIIRIMQSAEMRRSMGKRGKEIALARFYPRTVALKTKAVYEDVIQR